MPGSFCSTVRRPLVWRQNQCDNSKLLDITVYFARKSLILHHEGYEEYVDIKNVMEVYIRKQTRCHVMHY